LNPAIVTDDARLAAVVDEFIRADATDREHCKAIAELQARLRDRVTGRLWGGFLRIDEKVAARIADLSLALVRWAYMEGFRYCGGANRGEGRGT
jgi:hypothetical protein